MKIILNGQLIPPDQYTGGKGTTIEITRSDVDGKQQKSNSKEYTFSGAAYEMIKAIMIDDPQAKNNSMTALIYEDSCCSTDTMMFEGILKSSGTDWCEGECEVRATFIEHTEDTKRMDCIKSTPVDDDWNGFTSQNHPRVVYCNELRPDWLQPVILIFGIILNLILLILTPVVAALSLLNGILFAIQNVINSIPGVNITISFNFDGNSATTLLQEFTSWKNKMNQRIVGCGRKHPSPFVRAYIINVCSKCGIQFQSSIYNDPLSDYYNAMYFNAPIEKGTYDDSVTYIHKNHPIKTLDGFLDELAPVHNAQWKIIDGTLYFERKDFFNAGTTWVNFSTLEAANRIQGKLCAPWRTEESPAYIEMSYSQDPLDSVGNEALERFGFGYRVEWNQPFSDLQSGHEDVVLVFGVPRFRDDNIDRDILSEFAGALPVIQDFNGVLIVEKGVAFQPKLLIWDGVDGENARVKKYYIIGSNIPQNNNYNWPYTFNNLDGVTAQPAVPEQVFPSNYPDSSLYIRFYSIDNPRVLNDKGKEFTFEFRYTCTELQGALEAQFVQLPMGVGRITKMEIDLDRKTITVQGEV